MAAVYESVNILQRTAWRINPFVLDVFKEIHRLGLPVASLPSVEDIPPIPSPLSKNQKTDELNEQQKEKFKAWKRKEVERHDANLPCSQRGPWSALSPKLPINMHNMKPSIFHTPWILEGGCTLPQCF
jgi:DNA-directed RNA polymerase